MAFELNRILLFSFLIYLGKIIFKTTTIMFFLCCCCFKGLKKLDPNSVGKIGMTKTQGTTIDT